MTFQESASPTRQVNCPVFQPHSLSNTLPCIWSTASQKNPCPLALMCRESKCSCSQAARKETCENPSQGEEQHLWRFLATGAASSDPAPAHQEEGEVGKAAAHQVPWCPLEAQILPPSTKLCFFVSWTTKKHLCVSQSQTPPKIQCLL